MNESSEPVGKYSLQDFQAFKEILAISSSRCNKTNSLATALMALLPAGIRTILEKWNENGVTDFPWVSEFILSEPPFIISINNKVHRERDLFIKLVRISHRIQCSSEYSFGNTGIGKVERNIQCNCFLMMLEY